MMPGLGTVLVPLVVLLPPAISMLPTLPPATPSGELWRAVRHSWVTPHICAGMSKCVRGWCLPKDYQKLESPSEAAGDPVHVDINVEILDILSINDKEFSISMSMYFR